jgi:hypothetical protein
MDLKTAKAVGISGRSGAMIKADLNEFRDVLRRCWSVETSPQSLPVYDLTDISSTRRIDSKFRLPRETP